MSASIRSDSCYSKTIIFPQLLACIGGFFTLLNASWQCLTNLLAVVVTVPIVVLVLLPSCIHVGPRILIGVATLCLVNVTLEILSCLCDGTIYDVISTSCFFLAGSTCLCIARTLRTSSQSHDAAVASSSIRPTELTLADDNAQPMPETTGSLAPTEVEMVVATKDNGVLDTAATGETEMTIVSVMDQQG